MRFVAGWGAVAELLLAGAPWQSDCREAAPWRSCWLGRCGGAAGRGSVARGCAVAELMPGRSIGKRENSMREGKAASEKNMHLSFQMNKI